MTANQKRLYFREWAAVRAVVPDADDSFRHDLHTQALGRDKSSAQFTNRDLDLVLAAFRAITKPSDLNGQLRQAKMDRTRLLWKINNYYLPLLSLYLSSPSLAGAGRGGGGVSSPSPGGEGRGEGAAPYVLAILRDGFPHLRSSLSHIGGEGQGEGASLCSSRLGGLLSLLSARELHTLRNTLSARLHSHRKAAGHSIHQMHTLAALKCPCAACSSPSPGGEGRGEGALPSLPPLPSVKS